ncbi:MAG: AIR synthase-related protein [Methanocellales archaeon]|nr:AIR synthase-related protein [Methanocellales archaeon]MDD3292007.1 AIR synthase-related protein [Methanocellales archaeon]MDD5235710.1 AIR synthase-related protein [Methanocellales archaeon]MDD5485636.1 AIR synthase-related protein [Methanocellales archaeon]
MDLEGYAKRALRRGEDQDVILRKLKERIIEVKDISEGKAHILAKAVLEEANATLHPDSDITSFSASGVTMGDFGIGSRGQGDFYAHQKIAEVIGETDALIDSSQMDDSGVVSFDGNYIVLTVDGMHSRLSDFPFLAGFHVTRAALRDIYVMGARPIMLFSDIHLADDGDVAKIFDYTAGIATVSELVGVPLVTGSTLRIGGDMVIGDRMTGCVGAVGIASVLTARKSARPGDMILMTEGAGGGTIATTALYFRRSHVVMETLNTRFLDACKLLFDDEIVAKIHAMTDVTNGGIRGDAAEISKTAGIKLVFIEEKIRSLVNKTVLRMLDELEIDYLGVSLDALLIIAPKNVAEAVLEVLRKHDISVEIVGHIEEGSGAALIQNGELHELTPKFRESAYTPLKKVVGEFPSVKLSQMQRKVDEAAERAKEKKQKVLEFILGQKP